MIVLVDYNLNQEAILLSGIIASEGWLELVEIRLVTFREMELAINSDDRVVWQFAQANQMLLLTANRNANGEDYNETNIFICYDN